MDCCLKIAAIFQKQNAFVDRSVLKKMGSVYLEKKKYQEAARVFSRLLGEEENSEHFHLAYTTLVRAGELRKSGGNPRTVSGFSAAPETGPQRRPAFKPAAPRNFGGRPGVFF